MKNLNDIAKYLLLTNKSLFKQNPKITGLQVDSRKVKPGDLFICISGYTVDGHDFVDQAIENGAVAILAEKDINRDDLPILYVKDTNQALSFLANYFYDFPSNKLHLIGVTGTNGKTSITYLLDEIFRFNQDKTALIGTIQMKIADQVYPIANTTPEASFLQKSFKQMVDQEIDHCMMEVSSHALELGRVNGCDFDMAIYTNLSQDHLDFHQTMDDYLKAKTRLFHQLGNKYDSKQPKYAIINRDDVYYSHFEQATSQRVVTYGINHEADFLAKNIKLTANGTSFILQTMDDQLEITTPLIGKFNVYNMLAAIAAANLSGVPLTNIKSALEQSKGVRGRFEAVKGTHDFGVIIDFAHTPDSLENVLTTIRSFAQGKVYLVVGCGGDRDRSKRPLMAEIGEKYADCTILTSDNPRSEDPLAIIADMEEGMTTDRYFIEVNRAKAIHQAIQLANKNDIVLIAGKGHETTQIIGNEKFPFDDYQVAQQAIDNKTCSET
ncbi:UDP-N-acetylmuramoyl-L-alanyl-D-glutamate--2,6-diaminopimelate ligase [Amphibacillus sp. MSJ-3]|uniref:UDP-N-acetylmuramoyl-L-alanyl-D-glutamate--2, 6-diaminopimelate ligase n=1 Tax=Amphibacillus sp. MSJ-3 TaxID=2841505 RepID=UPI001C0EA9AD|nr:UDP-N-acetylmuramoyl-L-alanyl-D-glutamate--2,6-diaminopimelate ligase [Amphibacillus sp. MSJ-3]MBU5595395.1 UDP-N-acetylmuramoyl-L-alanyl-D-glutamate--2,6-diaminopimelate ligase [Amphibacillus sp. MSJ-3]